MSVWNKPNPGEEIVFGPAASPVVFTDIDLTQSVGLNPTGLTGAVLALLRISTSTGLTLSSFRRDGDSSNYQSSSVSGHGCSQCTPDNIPAYVQFVLVTTSTAGLIEWTTSASRTMIVKLEAWAEIPVVETALLTGIIPIGWTDLDTGLGDDAIAFLRNECMANPEDYAVRSKDPINNFDFLVDGNIGACSHGVFSLARVEGYLQQTDNSGILEHRSLTGALTSKISLMAYAKSDSGWAPINNIIFPLAAPPVGAYTALDLSSVIGARQTGVLLRVHREPIAGAGITLNLKFRRNGELADTGSNAGWCGGAQWAVIDADENATIFVESDANGIIEWEASVNTWWVEVEVLGCFNDPPTVGDFSPPSLSDNIEHVSISFSTSDDLDVAFATIDMDLTSPLGMTYNALINGIFNTGSGWDGNIDANATHGYDIILTDHPLFEPGLWTIEVRCEDIYGSTVTDTWTFNVVDSSLSMATYTG